MFAVLPDNLQTSTHGIKGGLPRSKKKALCDVKNTLLAKRAAAQEPLRKFDLGQPCKSENFGKPSAKEFTVKETPAKSILKQGGTFAIACDDEENYRSVDSCGQCNQLDQDLFFEPRPAAETLKTVDINFLATGLFCFGNERTLHLPDKDPDFFPSIHDDDQFFIEAQRINIPLPDVEPIPIPLSDIE